jgi:biotin carboxylase
MSGRGNGRGGDNGAIVLVGVAPEAEPYLRAAERLGLAVGLVETPERAAVLRERYPCIVETAHVVPATAGRDDGWIKPTGELAKRMRPDGVLASSEIHVLAAALAQEVHRLPGPGLDAAAISRDKSKQRFRFAAAGLAQPEHRKTPRLSAAEEWALERLPVVVKPFNRAGSDGVERISTPEEWADAVRRRDAEGPLLVEEYVEGQEYAWEGLVQDGQVCFSSVTFKHTTGAPNFVESAHLAAHERIDPALGSAARAMGQGVVDALGVRTGIMFVEFRAHGDRLPIMEVAVRASGDHCMDAISLAYGTDHFAEVVKLAVGEKFVPAPASERGPRFAGSCYVAADRVGVLESLRHEEWSTWPGVVATGVDAQPGALVGPPRSSADRLGWAVLDCDTHEELTALVARLQSLRPLLKTS